MQPLIVAEQLTQSAADFLRATFPATTPGLDSMLEDWLGQPANLFQGPYLSVPLPFRRNEGAGGPPFPWLPDGWRPYAHQAQAFARLSGSEARSTLVATGTGSGKTECFLFPILEHCRQARLRNQPGIKAIILYPMNALAGDQAARLAKTIVTHPQLAGVRAGLYVGEQALEASDTVRPLPGGNYTVITKREAMWANPPDILLTNYKMLDFLLLRAQDSALWAQQLPDTLRYLVVDELHTFDGAQGTDLACLIRRLKGRLKMPPGQLVCAGTSATLGGEGNAQANLLTFAGDIFGEPLDQSSLVTENRQNVAEFLADAPPGDWPSPGGEDLAALDPSSYSSVSGYLAAQYRLWFGEAVEPEAVEHPVWRAELGQKLKTHPAFGQLIRDLAKGQAKSVPLTALADLVERRLGGVGNSAPELPRWWLGSLLALVAHSRQPDGHGFFLQVRVEIWLRELRRMVAQLDAMPQLRHFDDLGRADSGTMFLPVIHCRDCHAAGWLSAQQATSTQLDSDLSRIYNAFFSKDLITRFVFPRPGTVEAAVREAAKGADWMYNAVCTACGRLHSASENECAHCGHTPLLPVQLTQNRRQSTRNGAAYSFSHHDCPFCGGGDTLSILGSQAASLAAILIGQLFGSRFNSDKKLIAFSDSVQDAAHRAGFFTARTWSANWRPALAQVVQEGGMSLADLPARFEAHWLPQLGEKQYVQSFMPHRLAYLLDGWEKSNDVPPGSSAPYWFRKCLPWLVNAEWGQNAHVGRTLAATGTATVAPDPQKLEAAIARFVANAPEKVEELRGLTAAQAAVFLRGFLSFLQKQGAWLDRELEGYARSGCNPYVLGKGNPLKNLVTSVRPPLFFSLAKFDRCVTLEGAAGPLLRHWAFQTLPGLQAVTLGTDLLVQCAYDCALTALSQAGLVSSKGEGGKTAWGLLPAAYLLHSGARYWNCDKCRQGHVTAPSEDWAGQPCRGIGCSGTLQEVRRTAEFYTRQYRQAEIKRLVAREHTGLLDRASREAAEQSFKNGDANLLSATPTLEMGIDIGDLSAVLLCSVPPGQANYIQRAGRAGRSTGNALVMTISANQTHDLYFWEDPLQMMTGDVRVPGVFLNASAVLERQLTAMTLDQWVRHAGQAARLPEFIREVLAAVRKGNQAKFPYPWLNFVEQNRASLLEEFVRLFDTPEGNRLTPSTQEWLRGFIEGAPQQEGTLSWKILNKLETPVQDMLSLTKQREALGKTIQKMKAQEVLSDEDLEEIVRLEEERHALGRLKSKVESKPTMDVLTDEGLIPNYAFPEQGVLLRSVIVRVSEGDNKRNQEVLEYERPGSAGITELAPNNTFYAGGRQVVVDQIDTSREAIKTWRFCRQCSYSESVAEGDNHTQCPRCGDVGWSDTGRKADMVRLTTVFAHTPDEKSRIGDDSDVRDRAFYVRNVLVDAAPQNVDGAYALDDENIPFGFEFLRNITFREVNFGEPDPTAQEWRVAGEDKPRPGFKICKECGTLQKRARRNEVVRNHAGYCSMRKASTAQVEKCVFLYREFRSEGVRIYLPEMAVAVGETRLHSFVAALHLGLEKRFAGAVGHLNIALDMRMAAGENNPQTYLVIYDGVPGGTGYLKDLMRDEKPIFEVLKLALEAMDQCTCNQDAGRDGCYRCVFRYGNRFERPNISRSAAQKMLRELTGLQDKLKQVEGLASVKKGNALFDSELEKLFVEMLRRSHDGVRFKVSETLVHGKTGYQVTHDRRRWLLEPQVLLGPEQNVAVPCKPDFVFWPDDGRKDLPVAVFLDGWAFHKNSIEIDLAKRGAVARSGSFAVWTLTWEDLSALQSDIPAAPQSPWADLLVGAPAIKALQAVSVKLGIGDLCNIRSKNPFLQLHQRLRGHSHTEMQRLATVLTVAMLRPEGDPQTKESLQRSEFWEYLTQSVKLPADGELQTSVRDIGQQAVLGLGAGNNQLTEIAKGNGKSLPQVWAVCRWNTVPNACEGELQPAWRRLWQVLNLLFPLDHCWVGSDTGHGVGLGSPIMAPPSGGKDSAWTQVLDEVLPEFRAVAQGLAAAGVEVPLVGYAHLDDRGRVVAEAEMAWERARVALVGTPYAEKAVLEGAGWQVVELEDGVADRLAAMLGGSGI